MERTQLPPEIAILLQKAQSGGLSSHDRAILNGYIVSSRGQVPAEFTSYLNDLMSGAPEVDPQAGRTAPITREGAEDWVSQAAGFGPVTPTPTPLPTQTPSAHDQIQNTLGQGGTQSLPEIEGPKKIITDWTAEPEVATTIPTAPVGPLSLDPATTLPPDRGGGSDRAIEREARLAERGPRNPGRTGPNIGIDTISPDSAFSGVSGDHLAALSQDPAMVARFIAQHGQPEGVNASAEAALIAPRVQSYLNLDQTGILRGRNKLEGSRSDAERLMAAEAMVGEIGAGEYLDPQTLFRQTFRNAGNTEASEMWTGEGLAGDPANQMAVTNGALLAAAQASMTAESQQAMTAKLNAASQEYMMGVANGEIDPNTVSYPEFLRTEKKARRWVGPGVSLEQARAAF